MPNTDTNTSAAEVPNTNTNTDTNTKPEYLAEESVEISYIFKTYAEDGETVKTETPHKETLVLRQYPLARGRKSTDKVGTYWCPVGLTSFSDISLYADDRTAAEWEKEAMLALWKGYSRALKKDEPLPTASEVAKRFVNSLCGTRDREESELIRLEKEIKQIVAEGKSTKELLTKSPDDAALKAKLDDLRTKLKAKQARQQEILAEQMAEF